MKIPTPLRQTFFFTASCFVLASYAGAIERISLDSVGNEITTGIALPAKLSADGSLAVFSTNAPLVISDNNNDYDIYLRNLETNAITRISVDSAGGDANGSSDTPAISANGLFVAFRSAASDLLAGGADSNGISDIFVRDLVAGTTTRVSVATGDVQSTAAFGSSGVSITGDGRYVAFSSYADDLVGGDTNNLEDIFLHDRNTTTTYRINLGPANAEAVNGGSSLPVISDNGNVVYYSSFANNLVPGATSGNKNIYGRDLMTNTTFLVSKSPTGAEPNFDCQFPDTSSDGNLVVYESMASNLLPTDPDSTSDIFLYHRGTDTTTLVSVNSAGTKADADSYSPAISGNGDWVGFVTGAFNLLNETPETIFDLYVKQLSTQKIQRVTVGLNGATPDTSTYSQPDFTVDGSVVTFESPAGNLVMNDNNMTHDVFIETLATAQPDNLISKGAALGGARGNGVYNTSGAGQKLTETSKKAKSVKAYLHVQNDAAVDQAISVRGSGGNRFFSLKYYAGASNETARIKQGTYTTAMLTPDAHETIRISCKPSRSKLKKLKRKGGRRKIIWLKKSYNARLTSTSTLDTTAKDVAIFQIKHR